MISTAAFIAASLDGYIARKDGSLDWLDRYADVATEDTGYTDFMSRIDVILMGRHTFEKVLTFGFWPYENTPVRIWSETLKALPEDLHDKAQLVTGTPAEILAQLDKEAFRRVYIDGGKTIQSFISAKLLDEITVTQIPVLLGRGISLFGPLEDDQLLKLAKSKTLPWGFVQNRYQILK